MNIAASLLMLAAAAAPQGGKPAPPAAAGQSGTAHSQAGGGVHATAGATAVIVRAAVVRLQEPGAARDSQAPSGEEIYRQTTRAGRHVSVDFN